MCPTKPASVLWHQYYESIPQAYYRNKRMEFTEKHPENARKETGERNGTEGFFSVTKGTTLLDGRPRKAGLASLESWRGSLVWQNRPPYDECKHGKVMEVFMRKRE